MTQPNPRKELIRKLEQAKDNRLSILNAPREFTDDVIKTQRIATPVWCGFRTNPPKKEEEWNQHVRQIENLFPHIIDMASEESTMTIGLTLLYQLGRNCLIKIGTQEAQFAFDSSLSDEENWLSMERPPANLNLFLSKSESPESILSYLNEVYPATSHSPRLELTRAQGVQSSMQRIAFFGLVGCLLIRSYIKEEKSLGYLYAGKDSKLIHFFSAFYSDSPPYVQFDMPSAVLRMAAMKTKILLEAKTLLFMSVYQFSKIENMDEYQRRAIGAIILQPVVNHGLPAIGWVHKAMKASGVSDMGSFLKSMLHTKTMATAERIVNFNGTYGAGTKGIYYPLAKLIDSDYLKDLGRELNAEMICGCYFICYYSADAGDRLKMKRFKLPPDNSRFALGVLKAYIVHQESSNVNDAEFAEVSMLKNEYMPSREEIEARAHKVARELYDDVMGEMISAAAIRESVEDNIEEPHAREEERRPEAVGAAEVDEVF